MLAEAVALLACPHCRAPLTPATGGSALGCASGHRFDVARQGYVNLLAGRRPRTRGDTPDMVQARVQTLAAGHLDPVSDAVADAVADGVPGGAVLDVGAGTGHHLAVVLDRLPPGRAPVGIGLDVSVAAARRCARAHPRAAAVVADTWGGLPVRDDALDAVLDVFAPRNVPEMRRVLRPCGLAVVVTPGPRHLRELVDALDLLRPEGHKERRLDEDMAPAFVLEDRQRLEWPLRLGPDEVVAMVAMGPSAWHVGREELVRRVARRQGPWHVTASVVVSSFRVPAGQGG